MKTNLTQVSKDYDNIKCEIDFAVGETEAINLFESGEEVFYSISNEDDDILIESVEMIRDASMLHYELFIKKYYT